MRVLLLIGMIVSTMACREQRDLERPPEDTIFLAAPSEDVDPSSSTERQAACASDTVVLA